MKISKFLLLLEVAVLTLGMISCSGNVDSEDSGFDPVNPVIYLEAGAQKGEGTEKSPYGDVLDAISKAKELGRFGAEHITLKFGAGNYFLTQTLKLNGYDFGTASLEMVCEDKEKAVIGAWLPVTNFTETKVNGVKAWVADMPKIDGETVYSHQFFSGDYERLERPRYPKEGFLYVSELINQDGEIVPISACPDRIAGGFDKNAFVFGEGDIIDGISRISDVQLYLMHFWNTQRRTLKEIDYDNRILRMNGNSYGGENFIDRSSPARYYLDNVFEALDSPGEIYNDSESGKLYYIPRENDRITDFTVFASTVQSILVVDGMNGNESQNSLVIKNIGFVGSDWKKENKEAVQAETVIPAAIQFSNASHIRIENCMFDHIGNYAIELKTRVNNVIFEHCSISDVGAGGIRISASNTATEDVPHDVTITDCTINGYGKVFGAAVGLLIQNAYDCQILHNEISDGYYTGISIGWVWGYGANATSNILVEKNHIYNIGQGILSDMGGIYTLGKQPGTVLRGNLIHDVIMYENGYGGWAYYTDEGSSDILIENNIGYNTSDSVYHHHYGANNIVRNNIFAFGRLGGVKATRAEDHTSFTFERNIVINNFGPIYGCTPDSERSWIDDSNLLWDYTLQEDLVSMTVPFEHLTAQEIDRFKEENRDAMIASGFYKKAVFADPLFADPLNYDFSLAENSPAFDIGFKPIEISDVGPRN